MTPSIEAALKKLERNEVPYNIATVFLADVSPADLDGARWRLFITDGDRRDEIEAQLSGSDGGSPGMTVDTERVERAVERRAAGFALESRLADMVATSRLNLRADDLV